MQRLISSLILFICFAASAQLPVIQLFQNPSSSPANITNLPTIIGGLEHRWKAVDLPAGPVLSANLWTDEVQSVSTWTWFTNQTGNGTRPTNNSDGLQFSGNQALVLSNASPNYLQFPASGGIKRSIFFIYSTTSGTHGTLMSREYIAGLNGGIYINLSGTTTSTAGNLTLDEEGSSEVIGDGLKTDGSLQDAGVIQTTIASNPHITGYTNGIASQNSTTFANYAMGCLGGGIFNVTMKLNEILVYTNWILTDAQLAATNHYYRTNCYGGSP